MKKMFFILLILSLFGCPKPNLVDENQSNIVQKEFSTDEQIVLLISMDGFRWDYMDLTDTPNLDKFVRGGTKAESLRPSFPSKTFPNHISIVTGSYPQNHGIVSNTMYDAEFKEWYKIGAGSNAVKNGKWYDRNPIWIAAEKQDVRTATYFWPASDAKIEGKRPTHYFNYDGRISWRERTDKVLDWIRDDENENLKFLTLYFNEPDHTGHSSGAASALVLKKVKELDDEMGYLLKNIEKMGLKNKVNILLTSDHGVASCTDEYEINIEPFVDTSLFEIVDYSPVMAILPHEGKIDEVYNSLKNIHPKINVYKKEEIPGKYHYNNHKRIQPIILIAEYPYTLSANHYSYSGIKGVHGFDPELKDMHGIFIANGPRIKANHTIPTFDNVHIYELMCNLIGIEPEENDGDLEILRGILI